MPATAIAGSSNNNQNVIINPTNGTIDTSGASTTFSGVFSGSGSFSISNSGVGGAITLAGANTYTGGTTINANADLILTGSLVSDVTINQGGQFDNFGSVTANVNNAGTFNNNLSAIVSGLLTNTAGTTTNDGTLNGGAILSGGMLFNNNLINGVVTVSNTAILTNNGTIANALSNAATFNNNTTGIVAGQFSNTDGTATNNGALNGGALISGGALVNNGSMAGASSVTGTASLTNNGLITGTLSNAATFNNNTTGIVSGQFSNLDGTATNNGALNGGAIVSGGAVINNGSMAGVTTISGSASLTNNGAILGTLSNAANFNNNTTGTVSGLLTNTAGMTTNNGALNSGTQVTGGTLTNNNSITGASFVSGSGVITNNGQMKGTVTNTASFTNNTAGIVTGLVTNTAGTTTNNGKFNAGTNITGGALINNATITGATLISGSGSLTNNATITGTVNNAASFINNAAGTVSGLVTNTAGTLTNNGQLNGGLSLVGGTLTGSGSIAGATTIMTGTSFVAGNGRAGSVTPLVGSLTFAPGSLFAVSVTPTAASAVSVNGSANLAGTVSATYASGSYVAKQYTILHATSLSGAFTGLIGNQPEGFNQALIYDATNVYLNLSLVSSTYTNLPQNQQNAANAITNYFNNTGSIPSAFGSVNEANLSQVTGTSNVAAQNVSNQALGQFLSTVLNPNTQSAEQFGQRNFSFGAIGYADDKTASIPQSTNIINEALAKAAPKQPEQKFAVWSNAYGNYSHLNGDGSLGTSSASAHTGAAVTGLDYYLYDDTMLGFALGGGHSDWTSASGGAGQVDLFQSSFYGAQKFGQAYVSGALGFGNSWVSSNRAINITGPDVLSASYQAQSFGGRIESGYKLTCEQVSLTPYIAGQFQTLSTPAYSEQSASGSSPFAMAYNAKVFSELRGEIGTQFALDFDVGPGLKDDVFAKLGYARIAQGNQSMLAQYALLSGSYFTLQGARVSKDLALFSLGTDLKLSKSWSFMSKIDTEFGLRSKSYGLTSQLQYRW